MEYATTLTFSHLFFFYQLHLIWEQKFNIFFNEMLKQPFLFQAISAFSPFFLSNVGWESTKNKTRVPPGL